MRIFITMITITNQPLRGCVDKMKKANQILILSAFLLTFIVTKQINVMQDTEEIWKDVVGYEGLYQVSSFGQIKSLPRNGTPSKQEKILSTQLSKGYPTLKLCKNNIPIRYTVHRLMGFAFMMDSYFEGAVINHKNGIPTDNRISNLEWCTPKQNTQHAWDNGLCKSARYWLGKTGDKNHTSKPILQFDKDLNFIREYVSATFAAKENGFSRQNISRCCSGTRPSSNGFIWKHKT